MNGVVHFMIVVISVSGSCSGNKKESWEEEILSEAEKELIEFTREVNTERALSMEIRMKKHQHKLQRELEKKQHELEKKQHELEKKQHELEKKRHELEKKQHELNEEKSKETFTRFLCAMIVMEGHINRAWNKNNGDSVSNTSVGNFSHTYHTHYEAVKNIDPCVIYTFLKSDEEYKLPREKKNFRKNFIKKFTKWVRYLNNRNSSTSQNITAELKNSALYYSEIYKNCSIDDYIIDFAFSLTKLHLLTNLINHDIMEVFFVYPDKAPFIQYLQEEMVLRGVKGWYFPLRYLMHINILLKSFNFEPLEYVYESDMNKIIPQSDNCVRQKNFVRGTTL